MSGLGQNTPDVWQQIREGLDPRISVRLGLAVSNAYAVDPKMLGFILARYKFCAKLLDRQPLVFEVGCGEAFGSPIVAQAVGELRCTDNDFEQIADNIKRNVRPENMLFASHNFCEAPFWFYSDACFGVDVIEHVDKRDEREFLSNIAKSLRKPGICIMGTPNATAVQYASKWSQIGHINLKTHEELRALMLEQFKTVFMFSMNDEVVHTGFAPMSHYVWAVGVGLK